MNTGSAMSATHVELIFFLVKVFTIWHYVINAELATCSLCLHCCHECLENDH